MSSRGGMRVFPKCNARLNAVIIPNINCCRASARQHTILDVLAFSCPVLPAELCIVEISIEFRGDVGFPGHIMYSSSFVNLRGLFNNILYSVFIYRCDETRETVKIINSLSGFISLLLFVQSQVSQQNFHECCEQATQRCVFQVRLKMRAGVVQQNFLQCCEQATQRSVFKVFYPKFSVHKVILSVSLVYIVSVYLSMWWSGLIKLRISRETGLISPISLLWGLCLWLTLFMATYYKSLTTMYMKEFKNL
jgi:hypothetical protein